MFFDQTWPHIAGRLVAAINLFFDYLIDMLSHVEYLIFIPLFIVCFILQPYFWSRISKAPFMHALSSKSTETYSLTTQIFLVVQLILGGLFFAVTFLKTAEASYNLVVFTSLVSVALLIFIWLSQATVILAARYPNVGISRVFINLNDSMQGRSNINIVKVLLLNLIQSAYILWIVLASFLTLLCSTVIVVENIDPLVQPWPHFTTFALLTCMSCLGLSKPIKARVISGIVLTVMLMFMTFLYQRADLSEFTRSGQETVILGD